MRIKNIKLIIKKKTPIDSLTSIDINIEKQFLYSMMKALRTKNDQVFQTIFKKLNDV